jgi:DNA-directed RNA polymerase specialized sigma24 family protein
MQDPADLHHLLNWLGEDTTTGARQYIEVHRKLASLFALRGCESPEALADETLDRTARAILAPGFTFRGKPIAYLRGVARNVYLESLRRHRPISLGTLPEAAGLYSATASDEVESLFECLDRCLAKLPGERRALLLRYYAGKNPAKSTGAPGLRRRKASA